MDPTLCPARTKTYPLGRVAKCSFSYGLRVLDTSRLRMRWPREADVDAVLAYRSRPDVAQYLSAGTWTREHTVSELSLYAAARFDGPGDELVLVVELLETGEVVGEVGLVWLHDDSAEIGYVFNPRFGGKGLATEAVGALLAAPAGLLAASGFCNILSRQIRVSSTNAYTHV